ncbi:MAG: PEP-CTERM sorting domain-containing protein [Desulfobulbaceae bacterium]|nr:PEP-CTERM sorting domain-containing protein [Desulfobulbaceae bacterium]
MKKMVIREQYGAVGGLPVKPVSRQEDQMMKNRRSSGLVCTLTALALLSSPLLGNAEVLPWVIGAPISLGVDPQNWIVAPTTSYANVTIAGGATLENWSTFQFQTGCDTCSYGLTIDNGLFKNGSAPNASASTTLERQTFLLNNSSGQVINNGTVNNYSQVDSSGSFTNDNQLVNFGGSTFTNRNGGQVFNNGQFVASAAAVISNAATGTFQNSGWMKLAAGSTFNSWGALNNTMDVSASGFFNNAGSVVNKRTLRINNDVLSPYSAIVPATGGFNNYGSLSNQGNLLIGTAESTIMLGSTPLNQTFVYNNGLIENLGTIELAGQFKNWTDGTLVNRKDAQITSTYADGEIRNYGNLINENGAYLSQTQLKNFGTARNDGIISVGGTYYQNGGVTVNNGLLWASEIVIAGGLYTGTGRASQLTLMGGAEFSPGDPIGRTSVGNLESYGKFLFDMASLTEYDVLNIENTSWFHDGGVEFLFADTYTETVGDRWDFIFGKNMNMNGFDSLDFTVTGLAPGTNWKILTSDGGSSLVITSVQESVGSAPVPEPATMLLMGSGLVGLIGARKKKKA